jgi:hypothetical protein
MEEFPDYNIDDFKKLLDDKKISNLNFYISEL